MRDYKSATGRREGRPVKRRANRVALKAVTSITVLDTANFDYRSLSEFRDNAGARRRDGAGAGSAPTILEARLEEGI